jgi:hypothetical protein
MISPIAEAVPERFERPSLKLLDRPDALLHDLCGLVESQPGDDPERHSLALLIAEVLEQHEDTAASEVLDGGVLGGGRASRVGIRLELDVPRAR